MNTKMIGIFYCYRFMFSFSKYCSRKDNYNVRCTLTPVRALRDGGVNVCLTTNNIRNTFMPYGTGDLLNIAQLTIPGCHFGATDDSLPY